MTPRSHFLLPSVCFVPDCVNPGCVLRGHGDVQDDAPVEDEGEGEDKVVDGVLLRRGRFDDDGVDVGEDGAADDQVAGDKVRRQAALAEQPPGELGLQSHLGGLLLLLLLRRGRGCGGKSQREYRRCTEEK